MYRAFMAADISPVDDLIIVSSVKEPPINIARYGVLNPGLTDGRAP